MKRRLIKTLSFLDRYSDIVRDDKEYEESIKLLKWNKSYNGLLRSLISQRLSWICTKALLSVKTPRLIPALCTMKLTMPSKGGNTLRSRRYEPKPTRQLNSR